MTFASKLVKHPHHNGYPTKNLGNPSISAGVEQSIGFTNTEVSPKLWTSLSKFAMELVFTNVLTNKCF